MRSRRSLIVLALVCFGCPQETSTPLPPPPPTPQACVTGSTRPCTCAGGAEGSESCDGMGWSDCLCAERAELEFVAPLDGASLDPAAVSVELRYVAVPLPLAPRIRLFVFDTERAMRELDTSSSEGHLAIQDLNLGAYAGSEMEVELTARLYDGDQVLAAAPAVRVWVDARAGALSQLRVRAGREPRIRTQRGAVRTLSADVEVIAADGIERAYEFITEFAELFGIEQPRQALYPLRYTRHPGEGAEIPRETVTLAQRYDGIPVYGSDITLQMRGEVVEYVLANYEVSRRGGRFEAEERGAPLQRIGFREAQERVEATYIGQRFVGDPMLVYYDRDLLLSPEDRRAYGVVEDQPMHLAWRLHAIPEMPIDGVYLLEHIVSAETGELLDLEPLEYHADAQVSVYDATEVLYGCPWLYTWVDPVHPVTCDENGCADAAHADNVVLRDSLVFAYDHFTDEFGYSHFYGNNGRTNALSRYAFSANYAGVWTSACGGYIRFAPGQTRMDLVGHEFQHGITHREARLRYRNSSGALNEGYSEFFGGLLWGAQTGSGFECDAGWDMCNYGAHTLPDHLDDYMQAPCTPKEEDNGQVHCNRAIIVRVGSLLAVGGTGLHNGIAVQAIGSSKAARLWWDILRGDDIGSKSGMRRMCEALVERSRRYAENSYAFIAGDRTFHQFNAQDACQVQNACAEIGVGSPDVNCDGVDDPLTDEDGDGIEDYLENCPQVANPDQSDVDGDGAGDACDADLDNDGVGNENDNCPAVVNLGQTDLDGDGVGDLCDGDDDGDGVDDDVDNCLGLRNGHQIDSDGDGRGDPCDDDRDGDGVSNEDDICPYDADPISSCNDDAQCSGAGNSCELGPGRCSAQDDADDDGVGDICDNCPAVANHNQRNSDNADDGGDACDPDNDDDGYCDDADSTSLDCVRDEGGTLVLDNCPTVFNPKQQDGDNDGQGFACDAEERQGFFSDALGAMAARYTFDTAREHWFPVPVCLDDCGDPFGPDPRLVLNVDSDLPVKLLLLNQFGQVVASSEEQQSTLDTQFPNRVSVSFEPSQQAQIFAGGATGMVGERYFVQVVTHPELGGNGTNVRLSLERDPTP